MCASDFDCSNLAVDADVFHCTDTLVNQSRAERQDFQQAACNRHSINRKPVTVTDQLTAAIRLSNESSIFCSAC